LPRPPDDRDLKPLVLGLPVELARLVKDQLSEKLPTEPFIINVTIETLIINVPPQPAPSPLAQPWVMILGAIFGALTLLFFMGLVLLGVAGHEVPCNTVFLVNITLSLGAALAVAFIGGNASATGAIPFLQNSLAVSVTGGFAALIIMLVVTFNLFGKNNCTTAVGSAVIHEPAASGLGGNAVGAPDTTPNVQQIVDAMVRLCLAGGSTQVTDGAEVALLDVRGNLADGISLNRVQKGLGGASTTPYLSCPRIRRTKCVTA
jgi:hypothetical protein